MKNKNNDKKINLINTKLEKDLDKYNKKIFKVNNDAVDKIKSIELNKKKDRVKTISNPTIFLIAFCIFIWLVIISLTTFIMINKVLNLDLIQNINFSWNLEWYYVIALTSLFIISIYSILFAIVALKSKKYKMIKWFGIYSIFTSIIILPGILIIFSNKSNLVKNY